MKNKTQANVVEAYPLSNAMIEDVFVFIDIYVIRLGVPFEDLTEFFAFGTESFVQFILAVETHFQWFDYTQAVFVIEILDIYIQKAHEEYAQEI